MKYSKENYFGLGHIPIGMGAMLNGWNISEEEFRDSSRLHVIDFRAMAPACPYDCCYCFTDKLSKTLSLAEIKSIIDQIAEMKAKTINFLGEGEPTIDPDFFEIIEYAAKRGLQPVIFTDAATKMRDRKFVKRVNETGASVCPKCDSLFNPDYQNRILGDKTNSYFDKRKKAIEILIEEGFNKSEDDGTSRLGFNMVISKNNISEAEATLRYCRKNNICIVFAFFLPAGRSGRNDFDTSLVPAKTEKENLYKIVKKVDEELGFIHPIYNNFITMPCLELMHIYGNGNVSPCPGNEKIIGNTKTHTIKQLHDIILNKFSFHCTKCFDGHCLYRPPITP